MPEFEGTKVSHAYGNKVFSLDKVHVEETAEDKLQLSLRSRRAGELPPVLLQLCAKDAIVLRDLLDRGITNITNRNNPLAG